MRSRTAAACLLALGLTSTLASGSPAAASPAPTPGSAAPGYDISWPQCPPGTGIPERQGQGQPLPKADATYVIVGLTNSPSFTPNPCLADHVALVRARHLWAGAYAVATYPNGQELATYGGAGTLAQRLRRVGEAEAAYNVALMRKVGLAAPLVWVDVEPNPLRPWPKDPAANNALLDGVLAGYAQAGLATGFYSYRYGWNDITGGRRDPARPTWVPAGNQGPAAARARCDAPSFSGGPVWLGQWSDGRYDYDVTCPGITGPADQQVRVRVGWWRTLVFRLAIAPSRFPEIFQST